MCLLIRPTEPRGDQVRAMTRQDPFEAAASEGSLMGRSRGENSNGYVPPHPKTLQGMLGKIKPTAYQTIVPFPQWETIRTRRMEESKHERRHSY